jgi:serine/threonine protein kinase
MLECPRCRNAYTSERKCIIDGTALVEVPEDSLVGHNIGRFLIRAFLDTGRMSRVYVAHDKGTDRDVALKVLHGEIAADADLATRMVQQAKQVNRFGRDLLVPVVDAERSSDGVAWIAREIAVGGSLARSLVYDGARRSGSAAHLARQIARALAKVHGAGLVYEDLRPGAVLLDEVQGHERARLSDFGAISLFAAGGRKLQKPAYVAPEQVKGGAASARSDLYVLGVMLYEMLIGFPPFTTAMAHLDQPVPQPKLDYGGLAQIAVALLDKDPNKRPHAKEVIEAIDKLSLSSPPPSGVRSKPESTADVVPIAEPQRRESKLRSTLLALFLVAIIGAVIGALAFVWSELPRERGQAALAAAPVASQPQKTIVPEPPSKADDVAPSPIVDPPARVEKVEDAPKKKPRKEPPEADTEQALAHFHELDAKLGRALEARGLVWDDLAQAAFEPSRRWGRWYKNDAKPRLADIDRTFEELMRVLDRAAAKRSQQQPAEAPPAETSTQAG